MNRRPMQAVGLRTRRDIEAQGDATPWERRGGHRRSRGGGSSSFHRIMPWIFVSITFTVVIVLVVLVVPSHWWPETAPQSKLSKPLDQDVRVSAVVMNHNRPRMIKESQLMKTLTAHPMVDEVLLCHSNPKTMFEFKHEKVTNVNAVSDNEKMGLSLRFYHCGKAKNEWVIIVDDDMEFSLLAINTLLTEFQQNTKRIVGHWGRGYNYLKSPHRHGYDTKTRYGPVEVVLTKFMVLRRDLCQQFFTHDQLVNDLLPNSSPLWNGEDIFMSLVANHVYEVPPLGPYNNYAIRNVDVWEASNEFKDDDTGVGDVSGNMDRHRIWNVGPIHWWKAVSRANEHAAYRGRLWYTAKQRLAALTLPKKWPEGAPVSTVV